MRGRRISGDRKATIMESDASMIVRVLKRLRAAVGYHELGMTQHALRCLDSLSPLGQIGSFGLVQEILRSEFVKDKEQHPSAAEALEMVARTLPTAAKYAVAMTLVACYGQGNDAGLAADDMARARGAKLKGQSKPAC